MPANSLKTRGKDTRFKKGQSGNPSGKAKGTVSLTVALKKRLAEHPELIGEVVDTWIREAISGNFPFFKELLERLDGKLAEKIEAGATVFTVTIPKPTENLSDAA